MPLGPSGATQSFARHHGESGGAVQFAYVTNFGSNNVAAYSVAAGGALAPLAGKPVGTGTEPWTIVIDPTGKFAYVPNIASNDVSAYMIDAASGALKK